MNIDFAISLTNVTPQNKRHKLQKAVRALSSRLGIPVSVLDRQKTTHNHGEPFLFRSHEDLIYKWYNYFSTALSETYNLVIKYFGLPEVRVLSKADGFLRHKGKVIYSPETGEPIKKGDWDDFVKLIEKFLNRKVKDADKKIILDAKSLGRVLNRMLKYNTLDEVKAAPLDGIKYRGRTFDWISDSVKRMRNAMGGELSRSEMARIQALQMSAAQKITKVSNNVKSDIKQILINGVIARKGKGEISQELFHKMTGRNRDFQMIADTEIQNALNNAILLDETSGAEPGEKIYFKRIEIMDQNTCKFCRKMNGVVVLWSDHPLKSDKIDDPIAQYAIWDGKDWDGQKEFVSNGAFHPYCRGMWARYYGETPNALIAELQGKAKEFNEALGITKEEYKTKGISPNDKTPGFAEKVGERYKMSAGGRRSFADAFKQARAEFEDRGIAFPTGRTPGFHARIKELYENNTVGKSLTYSGYKLQDRYKFAGFDISVENKAGSVRCGTDKDGHKWACKMYFDYGYIRGSEGLDGDHFDCYIGDNEDADNVYIVNQQDPATGKFDEQKAMMGFSSLEDAKKAYLRQYDRPGFLRDIITMPAEEFRQKVLSKRYHGKIVKSEYDVQDSIKKSFTDRVREALDQE